MKKLNFLLILIVFMFFLNSCSLFIREPSTPMYFMMRLPLDITIKEFEEEYKDQKQLIVKHGEKKIENINYHIYRFRFNAFFDNTFYTSSDDDERSKRMSENIFFPEFYYVIFKEKKLYKLGLIYEFSLEDDPELAPIIEVLRKHDY